MGIYHKVACHALRESIDPSLIGNGAVKFPAIAHGNSWLGALAIFAMGTRWAGHGCDLVDDTCHEEIAFDSYKDVTKEVVAEYNEWMPDSPVAFKGE